jgi:hypothetical protein
MNDLTITLTQSELCVLQCALSEAIAATMEEQMSADEAQFRALDKSLDLFHGLQRKLRRFDDAHQAQPDPRCDAYEQTDRTAWVSDFQESAA